MSANEILAWFALIERGFISITQLRAIFRLLSPDATEDELNARVQTVVDDAARRKALADQDVAQAQADQAGS